MTTARILMQAFVLGLSLTALCGPEAWRRAVQTKKYHSQLWGRLFGLIGLLWVILSVLSAEGAQHFGFSIGTVHVLAALRTGVAGMFAGLVLAQNTLRAELGAQFTPATGENLAPAAPAR
jgi:hypothetical protein